MSPQFAPVVLSHGTFVVGFTTVSGWTVVSVEGLVLSCEVVSSAKSPFVRDAWENSPPPAGVREITPTAKASANSKWGVLKLYFIFDWLDFIFIFVIFNTYIVPYFFCFVKCHCGKFLV